MPASLVFRQPSHLPLVAASILGGDFATLGDDCRAAIDAGADLLHLDVMDGHFVPNLTLGPAVCASLRHALPDVCLDVHLMVRRPQDFVDPFTAAGADHLTFHIEACDDPAALAATIHNAGMTAGLAISPPTDVQRILPALEPFDLILIMSVNPGFAGQAFIPDVLEKARAVRDRLRPDQRLQIDGGVNLRTASDCRDAGCDVLVAASAIFGASDYAAAITSLRGAARSLTRS